jgi:SAM-dependent methyltransferase
MKNKSVLVSRLKRLVRPLVRRDWRIPVGSVHWGDFRRRQPICPNFGSSRGSPVDRHYIEAFIAEHAGDVAGRVLEIKDAGYTRRFGGDRVTRSDVLDIDAANPQATIIGDLNDDGVLEGGVYDCMIVTQTLQYLFDPAGALRNLHSALKPGGVLLLTVPGITPVRECGADWYWNFTDKSVERLLGEAFTPAATAVRTCGNVASATAFLQGLSAGELEDSELAVHDPAYQLLIVARAVKAGR